MARKDRRETYWRRKRHPVPQSVSRSIDKENIRNLGSFTKGPIRKHVVGVVDENNVDILRCSVIGQSLCATTMVKLSDTSAPTSFEQGCILIETDVMNRIEDVVELVVNGRLYPLRVHEIDSLFRTEVDSGEDESTLIKIARVVEESSTTDKLIANKMVRESEGTIVSDSLGDVAHKLKWDLLEVTQRLDLRVIDCSENATNDML
ncbi:hypothetical protein V6N13_048203 [Hibiscus sabdariffa]